MTRAAIRTEDVGKQYAIATRRVGDRTLRDRAAGALAAPFRRLTGRASRHAPRGHIWALRHVSLEVARGEVVGLIGRNGAGKTTFLKILARITEPTEGRALFRGRVGSLLEVGTGFHPDLSGRENIFLNGALLGMRRREIQAKFDAIVAFAEVDAFLDEPVRHYSSGMYMRLAFAVAAHLDPDILLVDEVLAVGDAAFQKKCLGRMGEVANEGRTVLFVSHNMNAVEQMCSAVVWFDQGRTAELRHDCRTVINAYLGAGDEDAIAPSSWRRLREEFRNPWFAPVAFRVCDGRGRTVDVPAANGDDLWVEVEGEIDEPDAGLTVGYALHSDRGLLLYRSYHTDQPERCWPALERGRCRLRGRIPRRVLNEGTYRIELTTALHNRHSLLDTGSRTPTVYLTIRGGLSDSPHWTSARSGLLAPVLDWVRVENDAR